MLQWQDKFLLSSGSWPSFNRRSLGLMDAYDWQKDTSRYIHMPCHEAMSTFTTLNHQSCKQYSVFGNAICYSLTSHICYIYYNIHEVGYHTSEEETDMAAYTGFVAQRETLFVH